MFGVLFSVLLYNEQITSRLLLGFALIFAAIVISETFPLKRKVPQEESEQAAARAAHAADALE